TRLQVNGRALAVEANGRFELSVPADELAAGLRFVARSAAGSKEWHWAGLR
ncbi:MAG: hypothetical protein HUU35_17850, partial [Armatimonadetes bacterium]|nr:hypothetical protein [Armatimonadota bacterium]